ncbi:GNAT family N-acetyltransferase [Actinomadura darangshiensis]|uniref:GNAT family N-acetyltransferase n=1 Tax=Actinomadura darangshiensis TaxID=705336 RepID=A0A4R5BIK1_9ACTN|nr:GNAT family N-acetyltransferase [Actinomadura darangshiensis]TDD84770.1 GNAT family N-acetyltransferase [Actinomadura darangshiensis]
MTRFPELGRLVAEAWPAPSSQDMGGWLLRHAEGVTKRANSVLPLGDPGEVGHAVDQVEGFYSALGLPTVFSMDAQARPDGLDGFLEGRGYEIVDPTLAMVTDIAGPYEEDGVEVEQTPSREWLDLWWSVDGRYHHQLPTAEKILTGVPAGYASLDGVAVGRGVPQGEWLGIYAMAVAPEARRQGLGRRVLRALLAWGRDQGCGRAYLVVVERNAPARALYEAEGFVRAGGYHYRVKNVTSR